MEGSSTALLLSGIAVVDIITCSYSHNINGSILQDFDVPDFMLNNFDVTETRRVAGAMLVSNSNVWIDSTTFERNGAKFGTSIFIQSTTAYSFMKLVSLDLVSCLWIEAAVCK